MASANRSPQTRQFLIVPNYAVALQSSGGHVSQSWYRFLHGLVQGTPPDNISTLTLLPSPMMWTAPYMGYVVATGGTFTSVTLSRDPTLKPINLPLTGTYHVSRNDVLTFSYTGTPLLQFIPQ